MILSRRVALNSIQLDQVDESIVIRSIDPGAPKENIQVVNRMGGFGQRITGKHWESIDVAVTYAIDIPKRQLADRREVFDKVNAWAMTSGWLTINYMTGMRLYVDSVTVPSSADLWEWTEEFTITFRAHEVPFWQKDTTTTKTLATTDSGSGTITVTGTAPTVCNAEIKNESGATIDTLSVQIGSSSMSFNSLGLADNETLVISHADNGTLSIRIRNGSAYRTAMDKRTGGSADDLYVNAGSNLITITGGTVSATISCFGRYV